MIVVVGGGQAGLALGVCVEPPEHPDVAAVESFVIDTYRAAWDAATMGA